MSALVTYESFVDNCAKLLDQRFREFASAGMSIDLGHWMHCYAFDVIGEITVGSARYRGICLCLILSQFSDTY
jgi:hypothetical protein